MSQPARTASSTRAAHGQEPLLAAGRTDELDARGQGTARGHRQREGGHARQVDRQRAARDQQVVALLEPGREDAQGRGDDDVDQFEGPLELGLELALAWPGRPARWHRRRTTPW